MKSSTRRWTFAWLFLAGATRVFAQPVNPGPERGSLDSLLNTPFDFSLFNEQINAATKYGQRLNEVPSSVTVVPSDEILHHAYQTLEDVFRSMSGFYVSNDRNYSYVGVRGFGRPGDYNSRVLLLVNGHTMNEDVFGSALIGTEFGLDLYPFDRIEIVRGPGSALYGTGAMFATVNMITKRGSAIDGFRIVGEAGSFGRRRASLTFGKELAEGLDFFVHGQLLDINGQDLFFREYDTPGTGNGVTSGHDGDRSWGGAATLTYGDFSVQGMITSREKDIPTGSYETIFNDPFASTKTLDAREFLELKYDAPLAFDKKVMLRTYIDHYKYRGDWANEPQSFDAADGTWGGAEGHFLWDIIPTNRLVVGGEYRNNWLVQYRSWTTMTESFDRDVPFSMFSLYVQDELQIAEDLSLTLGVRRDQYSTSDACTTPRGAIIFWPWKETALKVLYGDAFRIPNLFETYYEDLPTNAKSNPALKPEQLRAMELVWEQALSSQSSGSLSLYEYRMSQLIDQTIDPADSFTQYRNRSSVSALGGELDFHVGLSRGTQLHLSYAYQWAQDGTTTRTLTNSPDHIVRLGLDIPVTPIAFLGFDMMYESGRETIHESSTDGYLLCSINLMVKPWPGHLSFALSVKNVFNSPYALPAGWEHQQESLAQDGRAVTIRAEATF